MLRAALAGVGRQVRGRAKPCEGERRGKEKKRRTEPHEGTSKPTAKPYVVRGGTDANHVFETKKEAKEELEPEDAPVENNRSCGERICEASVRFPCDPRPSH